MPAPSRLMPACVEWYLEEEGGEGGGGEGQERGQQQACTGQHGPGARPEEKAGSSAGRGSGEMVWWWVWLD